MYEVKKDNVHRITNSDVELQNFLNKGYVIVEEEIHEKEVNIKKKKTTKK